MKLGTLKCSVCCFLGINLPQTDLKFEHVTVYKQQREFKDKYLVWNEVISEARVKHPDFFFIVCIEKLNMEGTGPSKGQESDSEWQYCCRWVVVSTACEYLSPSNTLSTDDKICGSLNVSVDSVSKLFWCWWKASCHRSLLS